MARSDELRADALQDVGLALLPLVGALNPSMDVKDWMRDYDIPEESTCLQCQSTNVFRRAMKLTGPFSGHVTCRDCGHTETTMSYLGRQMVTVEPLSEKVVMANKRRRWWILSGFSHGSSIGNAYHYIAKHADHTACGLKVPAARLVCCADTPADIRRKSCKVCKAAQRRWRQGRVVDVPLEEDLTQEAAWRLGMRPIIETKDGRSGWLGRVQVSHKEGLFEDLHGGVWALTPQGGLKRVLRFEQD